MKMCYFLAALLCSCAPAIAAPLDQIYAFDLGPCEDGGQNQIFVHVSGDDAGMVQVNGLVTQFEREMPVKGVTLRHQDYLDPNSAVGMTLYVLRARRFETNRDVLLKGLGTNSATAEIQGTSCSRPMVAVGSSADHLAKQEAMLRKGINSLEDWKAYLIWRDASPRAALFADPEVSQQVKQLEAQLGTMVQMGREQHIAQFLTRPPRLEDIDMLREVAMRGGEREIYQSLADAIEISLLRLAFDLQVRGQDPRQLAAADSAAICANAEHARFRTSNDGDLGLTRAVGLPMAFWDDELHQRYLTLPRGCDASNTVLYALNGAEHDHRNLRAKQGWVLQQLQQMQGYPITLGALAAKGFYAYDPEGMKKFAIQPQDLEGLAPLRLEIEERGAERLSEELFYELRAEMPPLKDYASWCEAQVAPYKAAHPAAADFLDHVQEGCEFRVALDAPQQYELELEDIDAQLAALEAAIAEGKIADPRQALEEISQIGSWPVVLANRAPNLTAQMQPLVAAFETQFGARRMAAFASVISSAARVEAGEAEALPEVELLCTALTGRIDDSDVAAFDALRARCFEGAKEGFGTTMYDAISRDMTAESLSQKSLEMLSEIQIVLQEFDLSRAEVSDPLWAPHADALEAAHGAKMAEAAQRVSQEINARLASFIPQDRLASTPLGGLEGLCAEITPKVPEQERDYFGAECIDLLLAAKADDVKKMGLEFQAKLDQGLAGDIPTMVAVLTELKATIDGLRPRQVAKQVVEAVPLWSEGSFDKRYESYMRERLTELRNAFETVPQAASSALRDKAAAACTALGEMSMGDRESKIFCNQELPAFVKKMEARFACDASLAKAPEMMRSGKLSLPQMEAMSFAKIVCELEEKGAQFTYESEGIFSKEWFILRRVEVGGTLFVMRAKLEPSAATEGLWSLSTFSVTPDVDRARPNTSHDIAMRIFARQGDLNHMLR